MPPSQFSNVNKFHVFFVKFARRYEKISNYFYLKNGLHCTYKPILKKRCKLA